MQSQKIRDKQKSTCLKNNGCEHPLQNKEIREKSKATCLKNNGCENPMHNPDILEKNQENQYKSKEYTFKDGVIRKVQGWEPTALKILEEQYDYKSDDFIHHKLPKIYKYRHNFRNRYYKSDIPTPSRGDLKEGWIEVKSTYTFKLAMDQNLEIIQKGKAVILAGYHFEIWIFKSDKDLEPYKITSSNGIEEFEQECVIYYHNIFGLSQLPGI